MVARGFNCSESPLSSFFLVVFFFLLCSCLSHVLLTLSFILSLPSPDVNFFFRNYDWVNNSFFRHASTLLAFSDLAYVFFWSGLKYHHHELLLWMVWEFCFHWHTGLSSPELLSWRGRSPISPSTWDTWQFFFSSWKWRTVGRHNVWVFTPLNSLLF